ncbi:SAVED domain-containing protein [Neorhizobium galegae]|nr:SAVED domain-containing protein [Neorhizobium galegae]
MPRRFKSTEAVGETTFERRASIPNKVQNILWAQAAGRCEYRGCNELLVGDLVSNTPHANKGYHAHIIADSPDGPRGDVELSKKLAKDPDNIMLLCDVHHRVVDREKVEEHPATLLREMKREHEERIENVTAITHDRGTHPLRYAARIGGNEALIPKADLKIAIIEGGRFPIHRGNIDLESTGLDFTEEEPDYWKTHLRNLRNGFREKLGGRLERGEIKHITAAGIAPIPLLIELGRLLSDIRAVDVRQPLRNPKGFHWDHSSPSLSFDILEASATAARAVALKIEITAEISDERINRVLDGATPIWSIRSSVRGNDVMRRESDLAEFARVCRAVFDLIRSAHGHEAEIHLFPAIPASTAIEIGRGWQPKAHPSVHIYDENRRVGGFHLVHALDHVEGKGTSE